MAVNFEDIVAQVKESCNADQDFVDMMEEHREEIENCADENEALEKILEIMKDNLAELVAQRERADSEEAEDTKIRLSAEEEKYMQDATSAVEDFLKSKEWHYSTSKQRPDLTVYSLGFAMENCSLRARIYVEANPNVCRVDAVLPITGEALYEYPLCEKITKFNYMKRFGSLKYDERDGEITYEYSFLIGHQIYPDELNRYLRAVLSSADDAYAEIKKCCVGRFKSKEVNEILTKVNALVEDISDD